MIAGEHKNPNSTDWTRPGIPFIPEQSDSADLMFLARGLAFSVEGAVAILDENGNDVVIPSGVLAAGVIHPIVFRRLLVTGTTAENFLALR